MKKILVLGFGACGNQIAKLAWENEFDAIAINSSEIDLDSVKDDVEIILLSTMGCGKDRKISKALYKEKYQSLHDTINSKFKMSTYDYVFAVGSSSGGTCSGMLPVFTDIESKLLKKEKANTMFLNGIILPKLEESLKAQYNSMECMKEINSLGLTYLPYDNNTVRANTVETFEKINNKVIFDLKVLRGDFTSETSKYGVIDDMDMHKIISTKGMMSISLLSGIKENYIDMDKKLSDYIIKSIRTNNGAPLERDKSVKRMGYICNMAKELIEEFTANQAGVNSEIGTPLEIFEYISEECATNGNIITILAGLTFPDTRMSEMAEIISKSNVKKDVTSTRINEMTEEVSSLFDSEDDDDDEEMILEGFDNIDDVWSKY